MRRLAEAVFEQLRDHRRARATADEDDAANLRSGQAGIVERALHAVHRPRDQRLDEFFVFVALDFRVQVNRHAVFLGDEFFFDANERVIGELAFRAFDGVQQPRVADFVLAQIDPVHRREFVGHVVHQKVVEIVAAELRIAVAGEHLEHPGLGLDDRHIERTATEVVNEESLFRGLARVVNECGRGRLVDDPHDFQPGQRTGFARRLALAIVEVRGDRNHRLRYRLTQFLFGTLFQGAQDHRRDFLRAKLLLPERDFDVLAHLPLDRLHRAFRGQHPLIACGFADENLAVFRQSHNRRQNRVAVFDEDFRHPVDEHGDFAVRRPEVDTNDRFRHDLTVPEG